MGPFKLESVLGRGGMGTVYRATHSETNEVLAVKVLSPAYSVDDHFKNRFESEIKALLKLDHPNIVRLSSYGRYEQNLYFAMELVEGQSLFQLQRDGAKFHWREVIRIAKNVALGLRHAHDRGVIHRDLKPGNLIRAYTGIIKITDFGIAKNFGHNQDTGTNVLGTVDFMSPEQAKGQPVTFRSDLYSLGALMYTLLGGRPPFTANSVEESMRNLTRVPAPRISKLAPDVPKVLDDLVALLLEKNPEKRAQTALSLYHLLKQAEQKLKDSSEAMTAEHPMIGTTDKTSEMAGPTTSVDQRRESAKTVSHNIHSDHEGSQESGVIEVDFDKRRAGPKLLKPQKSDIDYYNAVTDNERQDHLDLAEKNEDQVSSFGVLALVALLLAVFAAAGYGIYRSNQIPSAETLFAEIQQEWEQPQKRFGVISEFLKHYPNHANSELVEGRRELAEAYHKVIQLRGRKGNVEFSEIETEFLNVIDGNSKNINKQVDQLKAMVTLYENQELPYSDWECVAAAKAYLGPKQREAEEQIEKTRAVVEIQLERGKNLPDDEAREVYESVIELYQDFEWLSDLLNETKSRLEALKSTRTNK